MLSYTSGHADMSLEEACTQCELIQHSPFTYNDAAITENRSTRFGRVSWWFCYVMQFQL